MDDRASCSCWERCRPSVASLRLARCRGTPQRPSSLGTATVFATIIVCSTFFSVLSGNALQAHAGTAKADHWSNDMRPRIYIFQALCTTSTNKMSSQNFLHMPFGGRGGSHQFVSVGPLLLSLHVHHAQERASLFLLLCICSQDHSRPMHCCTPVEHAALTDHMQPELHDVIGN